MKKILSLALCLAFLLTLCSGCSKLPFGKGGESSSALPSESKTEEKSAGPYKMGLLQFEESPAQDELREAFLSRLEEWGYDEKRLTIECENAGGDKAKAKSICEKFQKDGMGVIVATSSPAAEAAQETAKAGQAAVISIGGEDAAIQLKSGVPQTLALAVQLDPDLKAIGLLTNGENDPAKKEVETFCEAHELELVEAAFDGTGGSVTKAVEELSGKVSAFYTLPGTVSQSAGTEAARAAKEKKLAWYAGEAFLVKLGAMAAQTADLTEAGYEAADRAVRAMVGDTLPETAALEATCLSLNQTTLDALAVTVPEELLEGAALFRQES